MGSIRPLITITILAAVGAYLYVKINEGPTPSRAGANAVGQSIEGVPPLSTTSGASLAVDSAAPAWPPAALPAVAATQAPAANTAALASAIPTKDKEKDDVPAVPAIPELPPLPSLNDVPATPSAKDVAATPPIAATNDTTSAAPFSAAPVDPAQSISATSTAPPAPNTTPLDAAPEASTNPATDSTAPPANAAAGPATPPDQTSAQNSLRQAAPTTLPAADPNDRYATTTTTPTTLPVTSPALPTTPIGTSDPSSFTASWPAIQAALDHKDLKQAHQLLSKWHNNETLSPTDTQKVEALLSQLAGTVIYSTEHQLEPARTVKQGETLDSIAKEYNVTPQLLAKINGIQTPNQLQPGQQLKVMRGPFSAVIDLRRNELMLSLEDRYAGKFHIATPPGETLTDGQWLVDQKLPAATSSANPSAYTTTPSPAERAIVLRSAAATTGTSATLVIAGGAPIGFMANPPALRVSPQDAEEIADILSVGSRVTVRK